MMPGKRGSRRLLGDHMLTQQDLMQGRFPGCGGHRRLAHGRPSAGGLRPPRPAAEYGAQAAGSLRHPAALAVQPEHPEPVDGRPQHQRELRRLHFHARHGDLRRDRAGGRDRGRAMRATGLTAPRTRARSRPGRRSCSRRCCATTRRSRDGSTRIPPTWRAPPRDGISEEGAARAAMVLDGATRDIPNGEGPPLGRGPARVDRTGLGRSRKESGRSRSPSTAVFSASSR